MTVGASFRDKLRAASRRNDSLLCIGLDIDPSRLPARLIKTQSGSLGWQAIEAFNRGIVEATSDLVCAYKPNLAFYEALGQDGWRGLRRSLLSIPDHIPVIGDAKRGDIGSTSAFYAQALFEDLDFDAVTVSPYLGGDGLEPFLRYDERGVLVLCKTSNPGSSDFQDLIVEWRGQQLPLYQVVARRVAQEWNGRMNCGLVVGATFPRQLEEIRALAPDLPILIPGVGAQGGSLEEAVKLGTDVNGELAIINVSRAVLYASDGASWQEAARAEALRTVQLIRRSRSSPGAADHRAPPAPGEN
jgi:orotidine-5'-phosphate decarboxylase